MRPMLLTANDTFPTSLVISTTDPVTKVTTLTDITGYTIALEIDYGPAPLVPLVKAADILDPPTNGKCELAWAEGELIAGEWQAKLTITNAAGQKLSTEFMTVKIERDITPPPVPEP